MGWIQQQCIPTVALQDGRSYRSGLKYMRRVFHPLRKAPISTAATPLEPRSLQPQPRLPVHCIFQNTLFAVPKEIFNLSYAKYNHQVSVPVHSLPICLTSKWKSQPSVSLLGSRIDCVFTWRKVHLLRRRTSSFHRTYWTPSLPKPQYDMPWPLPSRRQTLESS